MLLGIVLDTKSSRCYSSLLVDAELLSFAPPVRNKESSGDMWYRCDFIFRFQRINLNQLVVLMASLNGGSISDGMRTFNTGTWGSL